MNNQVRMTPDDSAFWRMESNIRRMHSVTVAICDGPAPGLGQLRDHVARRVPLIPRFRQRVVEVPFDIGRPMWVDDPNFDLSDHLLVATPGSAGDLDELVSLILSEQLDRRHPLWQLTFVAGLDDDRWALISKVHHSMIDGLFGTEPLAVLVDGAVGESPMSGEWDPGRPPGGAELLGLSLAELMVNPAEQYRFARSQARRTRRRFDSTTGRAPKAGVDDPTGLRGPVGGPRSWSTLSVDMAPIRRVRGHVDANTHELILALITSGLRDLLVARGEDSSSWPEIKAIVPVAVAGSTSGFHGGMASEVVELPIAEPCLADRVKRLHDQTREASANPVAINAQVGLSGFSAAALASLGLREATRRGVTEREAHTVVVNVAGPRHQLSLLGRPIATIQSAPPLAAGVRLSFGVLSYRETLNFGVTADRGTMPDVGIVTAGIRTALEQLIDDTTGD